MTTAEATAEVAYDAVPSLGLEIYVVTYTKGAATDWVLTTTLSPEGPKVLFTKAMIDLTGADDPCSWSSSTNRITCSTGTGAGRMLVICKGQ